MAFRAVYVIEVKIVDKKLLSNVLFKRSFPVIEKKCRKYFGDEKYNGVPINFAELIVKELDLYREDNEFRVEFDTCSLQKISPIYNLLDGALFPVIAFKRGGLVYSCVVFEATENSLENYVIDSPGIVLAYEMLDNMAALVGPYKTGINLQHKISLLNKYVSIGFPFGLPSELDVNTVLAISATADGAALPKLKGPSWRPIAFKGKQTLQLEIIEDIRALQFDNSDIPDIFEVYGTIVCKVDVEESPEVSISLLAPLDFSVFNQMVYHPSVQLIDELTTTTVKGDQRRNENEYEYRKLRFCPPYDAFKLCYYKVVVAGESPASTFPVKAFYQMKADSRNASIMIQLQLSENMKSAFEYFEVNIPFFNRGPILNVKAVSSSMNLVVSSDKSSVKWIIGSKFPGKTRDISLEATVTFDHLSENVHYDELLVGLNAYIELVWKTNDFTFSGIKFDSKSVELYPNSKIKVSSASQFKSVEYKVWNSHGEVTDTTFSP